MIFLLSLLALVCGQNFFSPYEQVLSSRYTYKSQPLLANWDQLPISSIQSVVGLQDNSFLFLSSDSLYIYDNNSMFSDITSLFSGLKILPNSAMVIFQDSSSLTLFIASPSQLQTCSLATQCKAVSVPLGTVNCIAYDNTRLRVLVGTNQGLFVIYPSNQNYSKVLQTEIVLSVAVDSHGIIAAGTTDLMYRTLEPGNLNSFHFFRTSGIIDGSPVGMAFDMVGNLWIVNNVCANVQAPDLTFQRFGGNDGLPMDNLTSISTDLENGDVWIGSKKGVIRFSHQSQKFHYYYGPRYLPGRTTADGIVQIIATSLAPSPLQKTAVVTPTGVAIISLVTSTLLDKFYHFDEYVKYFVDTTPNPHPYVGYLAGTVSFKYFGNWSSFEPQFDENNGLWTAVYLAGECFRYALTKDRAVKERAWKYFEGLEFLNNVTGIKGLMARSVLYNQSFPIHGNWHNSSVYPGWIWYGNSSSDEVVGHMMVFPIVYRLLAETQNEKDRASRLVNNIVRYIVQNGFKLIDVNGQPTEWGIWCPELLNGSPDWYDERGTNSIQILSWLIAAYSITNDQYFLTVYQNLTQNYYYHMNIVNAKITQPSEDNYSDDELTYLPYLTYIFNMQYIGEGKFFPDLAPYFARSIERTTSIIRSYRPTPWLAIYYLFKQGNVDKEIVSSAIETLKELPWELMNWPIDNNGRIDIYISRDQDWKGNDQRLKMLPYNEIAFQRWNLNPFEVSGGGSGFDANDPGFYTFSYWLCRWVGIE